MTNTLLDWWDPARYGLQAPFSGDVTQDINPVTRWFSPTFVTYQGDMDIEEEVVTEVASFGKQLGKLTEAVLALADGKGPKDDEVFRELEAIRDGVERIKESRSDSLRKKADDAFQALLKSNPEEAEDLIKAMQRSLKAASARRGA